VSPALRRAGLSGSRSVHKSGGVPLRSCTTLLLVAFAAVLAASSDARAQGPSDDGPDPDQFTITAEQVEAEEGPRGRVVRLAENVTITRGGATLSGSRGDYYESLGYAVIYGGVTGTDSGRSIACDTLKYYLEGDEAFLIGNASYSDSAATTTARRIDMFRAQGIAVCRGDVRTVDAGGESELTAGRLVYDFDTGEGRASEGPSIRTYDEEGALDSVLEGAVIEYSASEDAVRAFGDVRIEREDIVARSRAASLARSGSMVLTGDPIVEQGEDTLFGERIVISTRDGEVSRVVATGNAGAGYRIDPEEDGGESSHGKVGGDTLTMYMDDGAPVLTTIRGNSRSEHFVGESGERNDVTSRAIDVLFSDGRISRVAFRGEATGTYRFVPTGSGPDGGDGRDAGAGSSPETELVPAPPETLVGGPVSVGSPALPSETSPVSSESDVPDTLFGGAPGGAATLADLADSSRLDSVTYASKAIRYYVERNRIVLAGGARVEYETTVLHADEVIFDPDEQVLEASGNPDLREKTDRLVGAQLQYDLERKAGAIDGGVTTFEDGLYYGERIVREEDGTLKVRGGTYTTCTAEEPHYRLVSHRMKIYMDDKVVAKPVILYIGKIPVLALPFYVFPIRKERHSGFLLPQIELGISEGEGRFIRNFGYYYAPNDYWDASVWADFYEETRWIAHAEARYKLRYVLSGSVRTSFMQQLLLDQRRWDLKVNHRQEIGRVWTAGASGDFRSDATYASDSNQSIQESVNRSLHSQLWLRGRWSSNSVGVTLDRREDLDDGTVDELLPKVEISATQRPVVGPDRELPGYAEWLKKVSYSWSARAVNDRYRDGDETEVHQGVGAKASIRGSEKLLGWLTLSPSIGLEQNWYDRDKDGNELPSRLTYSAGLSARTTVYGTFFPRRAGVSALRHIVEPSASFSWTPEFNDYFDENGRDRFYSFSGFGSTPTSRRSMSLSLVNKLQAKLGEGESERRLDNLLRLSTSTAYDFKKDDMQWSDLSTGLEIRPGSALSVRWNARHDAYDGSIESSSITATVDLRGEPSVVSSEPWEERVAESDSPADQLRRELEAQAVTALPGSRPWDASLTFRYSRGADPANASYWVDSSVAFAPTKHWRFNYSVHYDLEENEVASQEYTIYRDLHCWEAQFTRRYYEEEWQYYFRINVKALPEIQAESGKSFLQRSVR